MKTLPYNFTLAKDLKARKPVMLAEILFPWETVKLSDRDITVGGVLYKGLVVSFGEKQAVVRQDAYAEVSDMRLTISNRPAADGSRFSDHLNNPARIPEDVTVRIYQYFIGIPAEEKQIIFSGVLRVSEPWDNQTVPVDIVHNSVKYNNKIIGEDMKITAADYPAVPDPSNGRMKPIILGTVAGCRAIEVTAGGQSTLREALSAGGMTVKVADAKGFKTFACTIQIDNEKIRVGTPNSAAPNNLPVIQRGYGVTTAANHDKQTWIWEIRSYCEWLAASHDMPAMSNLRTEDGAIGFNAGEWSKVTNGKDTLIRITDKVLKKKKLTADEGLHLHSSSPEIQVVRPDNLPLGGDILRGNIYNGDTNIGYTPMGSVDYIPVNRVASTSQSGTINKIWACYVYNCDLSGMKIGHNGFGGIHHYEDAAYGINTVKKIIFDKTWGYSASWIDFAKCSLYVKNIVRGNYIMEMWWEVEVDNSPSSSAATGAKTSYSGGSDTEYMPVSGDLLFDGTGLYNNADPGYCLKRIAVDYGGIPEAAVAADTGWPACFKLESALYDPIKFGDLMGQLGLQALALPYWRDETYIIKRLSAAAPNAVKLISRAEIAEDDERSIAGPKLWRTDIEDVYNCFILHYNQDPSVSSIVYQDSINKDEIKYEAEKGFAGVSIREDTASQTKYKKRPKALYCGFIRSQAMAEAVADYWLAKSKDIKLMVEIQTYLDMFDIEGLDAVGIQHVGFDKKGKMIGLKELAGQPFEIMEVGAQPGGDGKIETIRLKGRGDFVAWAADPLKHAAAGRGGEVHSAHPVTVVKYAESGRGGEVHLIGSSTNPAIRKTAEGGCGAEAHKITATRKYAEGGRGGEVHLIGSSTNPAIRKTAEGGRGGEFHNKIQITNILKYAEGGRGGEFHLIGSSANPAIRKTAEGGRGGAVHSAGRVLTGCGVDNCGDLPCGY